MTANYLFSSKGISHQILDWNWRKKVKGDALLFRGVCSNPLSLPNFCACQADNKVNLVDGYGKGELVYEEEGRVNWSGGIRWGRGWYSRVVRLDLIPLLQRRTICISSINAQEFWRLYTDTCRIDRYNLIQLTTPSNKLFWKYDPIFLLKTWSSVPRYTNLATLFLFLCLLDIAYQACYLMS